MSTGRGSILVVDDSLTIRMGLERTLLREGFHVELASARAEAEALLARAPFALVILDLNLADGSSMPLLRRLNSGHYRRQIPGLVISGSEGIDVRLEALSAGADFIAKPYDGAFLVDRVRSLCGAIHVSHEERPRRVLVIDDSAAYGNAVAHELRRAGHDVILAATAGEGLRYLALQRPERVLLDVFLPDADGIDVARRIRELPAGRDLPLLLLTGRESANTRKRASQAGVTAFLTKDTPLSALAAWVWRPAPSNFEGPPSSGVLRAVADAAPRGALFDSVVASSGLSVVLGRSALALAMRRAGVEPEQLTPEALALALDQIEKTLSTFLPPDVVGARISSIARLARERSHAVITK